MTDALLALSWMVGPVLIGAVGYWMGWSDARGNTGKRRSWVAPRNGGYSAVGPARKPGPPPPGRGSPSK